MMYWAPLPMAVMTAAARNSLLLWLGVLLAIVVLGGVVLMVIRRKLMSDHSADDDTGGGFLLSDLRKMRDNGEITAEEYEMTRAKVVARVKAMTAETPRSVKEMPLKRPQQGLDDTETL